MKKIAVLIISIALVLSLVPAVVAVQQCWRWSASSSRWEATPLSGAECRMSVFATQWTDERPTEPPEGAQPPSGTASSGTEEAPVPSPSSSTPPEGTTLGIEGGQFFYQDGRWWFSEDEGGIRELAEEQQERLTRAWNDPAQRGRFIIPEEGGAPEMTFPLEEAEAPSRSGATYSGPTGTYRTLPADASDDAIDAALERCRSIAATGGQCHRDGNRIVMGPEERGRGRGEEEERAPERGSETEIHFFPPVDDEESARVQQESGEEYMRGEDGGWTYTGDDGRQHAASDELSRRFEERYWQQQRENLEMRRAACQEAHAGRCTISGDQVVFSRDETLQTLYFGAYTLDSDELRENLERCNEAHGDRCWSDDRGNIQYRRTESEQSHEYWMYNAKSGQIEPATEAQCAEDNPAHMCCTDSQEQCEEAGGDYEAAVERSRIQNIWEGKQVVRGWIKIFEAFGLSDEWDREAFDGLHRWAETRAGLAVTGRWQESICRYTPDFDNPTGLIQYPGSGQFGIWIEGAKTVTLKRNESEPSRGERVQKLYKITGSVMPAGLTHNSGKEGCTDRVKFTIMLDDDVIDLGEPGSVQDIVDLKCDSAPYSLEGQNALYIISRSNYERVCWRFQDTPLHDAIREQLRDGKLCARIVESGTPEDLGCKQAEEIDCSRIETAPTEDDSSRGGIGEPEENRPAPRPPAEEI